MVETESALKLDDQLCFALYAASRAMTARYRPLLDAIGLTFPQFLVMMILWGEGPSTVSMLGERLRLDSGTLSPLLKRLETNDLITRTRRADDERSVEIQLTAPGSCLRERAADIPGQVSALLGDVDHRKLQHELRELEVILREE